MWMWRKLWRMNVVLDIETDSLGDKWKSNKMLKVKIGEACKFCGATEKEDFQDMKDVKELIEFVESQRDGDDFIGHRG
jgi:hypothetical protein